MNMTSTLESMDGEDSGPCKRRSLCRLEETGKNSLECGTLSSSVLARSPDGQSLTWRQTHPEGGVIHRIQELDGLTGSGVMELKVELNIGSLQYNN